MKKLAGIIFLMVIAIKLMAQEDPKLSQRMFLLPLYNPGAVGQSDKVCASAAFRNQWGGLPGAPVVSTFSAHMPFNLFGRSHGAGINFVNDNIALSNQLFVNLAYSFKTDIGGGVLGTGINAGMGNLAFDPEGLVGADVMDQQGDLLIPQVADSRFGLDVGIGAYYSTERLYFGLSAMHLGGPKWNFSSEDETGDAAITMNSTYYAIGGYTIQLPNPTLELMPVFMVQTDLKSHHFYLNTNLRYNKRFWGGVSYSVGGAVSILAGIELLNGIKVGYSYDIEMSRLLKYSSGSHEITVRYCFDLSLDKTPQKYESIRFL